VNGVEQLWPKFFGRNYPLKSTHTIQLLSVPNITSVCLGYICFPF
jgi:hypothetical protein